MAKLTVYFQDKPIFSNVYDSGTVYIGRDEASDVMVDNLAVAPIHAVMIVKPNDCVIRQLNDGFPLVINNIPTKEHNLQDKDIINIGKHFIVFNVTDATINQQSGKSSKVIDSDVEALNEKLEEQVKLPDANLQIMGGVHIGRILPLKKPLTRLGREDGGVLIIARRKEGYFVSALQGQAGLLINEQPLGDQTLQLQNNDVILVDKVPMQFFQD